METNYEKYNYFEHCAINGVKPIVISYYWYFIIFQDDHYALICDGKLAGVSSSRNRGCPRRFTHISRLLTWIRSVIENK